jgi:Leucine-rich repeat (LRR) protein
LEHLKGLVSLKRLHIHDTRITDAGLDHLKNVKSLTELAIGQTRITAVGLEKLKQALPSLKIHWADAPIYPPAPISP